ncbi:MAG: hydantoinase/oxoprolinase family protein [Treponema sp.]|nr:hydantoinase/oxoprolinase family protein [Treponema sp.]
MDSKLGIGIDTGGTYTDAVIYDFSENKLIAAAKALTTRQDLSIGILEALSALPADKLKLADFLSLSTTLATNACVEDRGGRAKLVFLGGDGKVINELGGKYGLPPAGEIHIQDSYTTFSGQAEREPDWDLLTKSIKEKFNNLDGAGIIELYAMKNNAVLEKKAASLFREIYPIPVVCGYELFSDLNSLQRAAGTLLNARLFPVIKEFLDAIKKAMAEREINARTVIVRSDCSLMSEEFACVRPVETLLSGPAASISGGNLLSDQKDCIIIDMGGTTTDIALVENGNPVMAEDGISVGKWKTFVKGFAVRTFGLGGDTAVHFDDNGIYLEDYRVQPLCVAAAKYPAVTDRLRELAQAHTKHSLFIYEHFILGSGIRDSGRYTEDEKKFCKILENGPLPVREAAELMGSDIYNFNPQRLLAEGVVLKCGFTPTDVMHLKNDFSAYSAEASLMAAKHIAFNTDISVEQLCGLVYDEVKRKLYFEICNMLLENHDRKFHKKTTEKETKYFIQKSYEAALRGSPDRLLDFGFKTAYPLVGLGAPIRVFLDDVARLLGTTAIVPQHYEVANALGAVAGKIRASYTVEIRPDYSRDGITGFKVFGFSGTGQFRTAAEAGTFAAAEAEAGARAEIVKRGGRGEPAITVEFNKHEGKTKNGSVYLGTSVTALAVTAFH